MTGTRPEGLTDQIRHTVDRLPACMADTRAREALLSAAGKLPRSLAGGPLGLELRLAGTPQVDLFAAAVPRTPAFADLIAALEDPLDGRTWTDPGRARDLARALTAWNGRTGALPRVARYLLVEVDAPAPGGKVAPPSVFLAPRGHRDLPRPGQPPNAFEQHPEATVVATAELSGMWPDPAIAAAMREVIEALPPDADIFAVGTMLSRGAGSCLRLAIRRLPPARIRDVLTAAGYPAQARELTDFAASSPADRHAIAFEVGPGAETRVGLELSPAEDWKQASSRLWPQILDHLKSTGVAEPERAGATLGLVHPDGEPLWGLAHVKVAATPAGMMPAAKLYVGLLHREFPG